MDDSYSPDLSDLDPETQQYIHQLQDQVQFLDKELQKSEQEKLELVQEMGDAVEDYDHLLKRVHRIEKQVKERKRKRKQAMEELMQGIKTFNKRIEEAFGTPEEMERKKRESQEIIDWAKNAEPLGTPDKEPDEDS